MTDPRDLPTAPEQDTNRPPLPGEPGFRRLYPPWSRTIFAIKMIVLPIVFLGSAAAVIYGAIWLSFSPPREKIFGLLLILVAITAMTLGMWVALDRPKQWFAPGVNDEPVPGRRLPRWFRKRRESSGG